MHSAHQAKVKKVLICHICMQGKHRSENMRFFTNRSMAEVGIKVPDGRFNALTFSCWNPNSCQFYDCPECAHVTLYGQRMREALPYMIPELVDAVSRLFWNEEETAEKVTSPKRKKAQKENSSVSRITRKQPR